MQDHGSIGRMVALVPVTWDNNFPIIGLPGNLRKAPNTWLKPDTGHSQPPRPPFVRDDRFETPKLSPVWQWNHEPDDAKWSLTEKPGVLRLHSLPAGDFWTARNSLTQRPPGPECVATVELDASGLVAGDSAGLALVIGIAMVTAMVMAGASGALVPMVLSRLGQDPAIRTGTLPNGLTYYIRENGEPEKRALLRLAVKAGSIDEEDDQRGLAHMLEHMAFNGTTRFKPGELVTFLESIGSR